MPGYEVFSDDGTLVVRLRRDDGSPIPEDELREVAVIRAPKTMEGKVASKEGFKIKVMDEADYMKSRDDHVLNNLGVPTFDDKVKITKEEWEENMALLNPDFIAKGKV